MELHAIHAGNPGESPAPVAACVIQMLEKLLGLPELQRTTRLLEAVRHVRDTSHDRAVRELAAGWLRN